MADEMPARARASDLFDFRVGLLHAILAEVAQARREREPQHLSRLRLADADERNLFGRATAVARGALKASAHFRQTSAHSLKTRRCFRHSFSVQEKSQQL